MKPEIISGVHSIEEALRARRREFFWISIASGTQGKKFNEINALAKELKINIKTESRENLNRLCSNSHHQGIAAQVSPYPYVDLREVLSEGIQQNKPILILDGLEDPHNVGALLRTANASGIKGIIIPKDRVAQITPTVSRVSAGAAEHLYIAAVSNWSGVIKEIKKKGYWLVGLDGSADKTIFDLEINENVALVVGGEGGGMRAMTKEKCDFLCKIPMVGNISSLNASVAGAVAMYEIFRKNKTS